MIRFKYKNKVYETPNLLKKLKRMKLTIDLVEILENKPQQLDASNIPEWEEKGLVKYSWVCINPYSELYKFEIAGLIEQGLIPDKEDLKKLVCNIDDWELKIKDNGED